MSAGSQGVTGQNVTKEHYKGRVIVVSEDAGFCASVYDALDGAELYATSPHFAKREEALATARDLVDTELAGHPVTPPDGKGGQSR